MSIAQQVQIETLQKKVDDLEKAVAALQEELSKRKTLTLPKEKNGRSQ